MSEAFTPLRLEFVSANTWRLTEPMIYQPPDGKPWRVLTVYAGFETDLASIPKLFHNLLSPSGKYARAAVLHDWLYVQGLRIGTRKQADDVFLKAMKEEGVSWLTRNLMHGAVRRWGWLIWNRRHKRKLTD